MAPEGRRPDDRYRPLALIGITLIALLGFAVFFLSFLVAPLAILVIFYIGFAASDRSKRTGGARRAPDDEAAEEAAAADAEEPAARLAREAQWRRQALERAEAPATITHPDARS